MTHSQKLIELVRTCNQAGGSYHRIDFGEGLVLEGEYDMAHYLDFYGLPKNLSGSKVLDVGTSTGFFALECARRGAEVTAIDLWAGGPLTVIAEGLGLQVDYLQMNVYDLAPSVGEFDLVICGSVLLHLWDPFRAIHAIASVCRHQAIIATAILEAPRFQRGRPLAELIADRATDGVEEYWATWRLSVPAMEKLMKAAGFSRVDHRGDFLLDSLPGGRGFRVLHGVFHGFMD